MYKEYDRTLKSLSEAWNQLSERHLIESATVTGEYWIIDGSPVYADGDVGDMNHEAYVVQHLIGVFANLLGIDKDEPEHLSNYEDQIKYNFMEDGVIEEGSKSEELYDNDPADFMLNYLTNKYLHMFNNDKQQLQDAFFLAYGSSGMRDARDYGMKHLGWIRVAGNNIQTWTLTQSDMDNISRGISSIISDESRGEDEDTSEMTFNIETMSNKKFYMDIPFEVIDSGDATRVIQYREN